MLLPGPAVSDDEEGEMRLGTQSQQDDLALSRYGGHTPPRDGGGLLLAAPEPEHQLCLSCGAPLHSAWERMRRACVPCDEAHVAHDSLRRLRAGEWER